MNSGVKNGKKLIPRSDNELTFKFRVYELNFEAYFIVSFEIMRIPLMMKLLLYPQLILIREDWSIHQKLL